MQLDVKFSIDDFFPIVNINEDTCLVAFWCTLQPTLFLKCKPINIWINAFNIYGGSLWEVNTTVKIILDPFVATNCYTFYLTKVENFVTR
jgi:hypothetical protein